MPLRILISAYACVPNQGSEPGIGWNWVINLAQYCQLTVITEVEFKKEVEEAINTLELAYLPKFYFIDTGKTARNRCRNQGNWLAYIGYRRWQWRAYKMACEIISKEHFDLIHQLTMTGYREPGYLWKLPLPFVWGPVGGYAQMPWRFFPALSFKGAIYFFLKNIINAIQMRASIRVQKAVRKAAVIIAATKQNKIAIQRIYNRESILINDGGVTALNIQYKKEKYHKERPLSLVWCGRFYLGKVLNIALKAIALAAGKASIEFHIVGSGINEKRYKIQTAKLGIENICHWYGHVNRKRALEIISNSDCMVFTSLQETTPAVIMEALQQGVPVICHDICGQGDVIDDSCGIKIPVISPAKSIKYFAEAIISLYNQPKTLSYLSEGALKRAEELLYAKKASEVIKLYSQVLAMPKNNKGLPV